MTVSMRHAFSIQLLEISLGEGVVGALRCVTTILIGWSGCFPYILLNIPLKTRGVLQDIALKL